MRRPRIVYRLVAIYIVLAGLGNMPVWSRLLLYAVCRVHELSMRAGITAVHVHRGWLMQGRVSVALLLDRAG